MFINFWKSSGGVSGDYSYGVIHIVSVVVVFFLTIVLSLIGRKISSKNQRKTIVFLATFFLAFEVFWRIIFAFNGEGIKGLMAFYPCNFAGIIVPLIAFSKSRILKEMFYVFAVIGGLITFAYPQGIFNNQVLNFYILKSIIQHIGIILIPVFEIATGNFIPKLKRFFLPVIGLFVHLINGEYVPKLFGWYNTDYLFFEMGLPFTIQNVPQVFIMGPFAILVMLGTYMLLDLKGTKKLFKGTK